MTVCGSDELQQLGRVLLLFQVLGTNFKSFVGTLKGKNASFITSGRTCKKLHIQVECTIVSNFSPLSDVVQYSIL